MKSIDGGKERCWKSSLILTVFLIGFVLSLYVALISLVPEIVLASSAVCLFCFGSAIIELILISVK